MHVVLAVLDELARLHRSGELGPVVFELVLQLCLAGELHLAVVALGGLVVLDVVRFARVVAECPLVAVQRLLDLAQLRLGLLDPARGHSRSR